MFDFSKEQGALDEAMAALVAAINRRFPVGTCVTYKAARGLSRGSVHAETRGDRVIVRSEHGKVHHKHYSDIIGISHRM